MMLAACPFLFLRHGETVANASDIVAGFTDVDLTEKGRQQALAARARLPETISHVAASTLRRAYETAALAAPGHAVSRHADLRERNWGDMEGQPVSSLGGYYETPPGGESFADFADRVTRALNAIIETHHTPLIVAHSGLYRVVMHHVTGSATGPRISNCQPVHFAPPAIPGGEWTIRRIE